MLSMYGVTREEAPKISIAEYSSNENPLDIMLKLWEDVIKGIPQEFDWVAKRPHDNYNFFVQVNLL